MRFYGARTLPAGASDRWSDCSTMKQHDDEGARISFNKISGKSGKKLTCILSVRG
jgi:hypothetical protein